MSFADLCMILGESIPLGFYGDSFNPLGVLVTLVAQHWCYCARSSYSFLSLSALERLC